MKYLCVFDMDNTLLSPDKTISPENKASISTLRDLGIGVTIATGRSPFLTGKHAAELAITLPVITCNGGMLITFPGFNDAKSENTDSGNTDSKDTDSMISGSRNAKSEIIWENPIHETILRNLLHYLLEQRADFLAYSGHTVYFTRGSIAVNMFREHNRTSPAEFRAPLSEFTYADLDKPMPDICKVLLYSPTAVQDTYIRSIPGLEAAASTAKSLDIMQSGSTKGSGILSLSKYLDIPPQNIAVFGDNENDVSMFTCGALGIAMGNSTEEIKQKTRYITGTNAESGVAQGIYKFVLPYFGVSGEIEGR